jgi:hypothetical protein
MLAELIGLTAAISNPSGAVRGVPVANFNDSGRPQTIVATANIMQGVRLALSGADGRTYPPPPPPPPDPPASSR